MSKGSEFRMHLTELREAFGVRCETCVFFTAERGSGRCTLKWEWTAYNDWCPAWDASTMEDNQ